MKIVVASDCLGAAAPEQTWLSTSRVLQELGISKLDIREAFGSEHASATHAHKYLRQNFAHEIIFDDVVERARRMTLGHNKSKVIWTTSGDGDGVAEAEWPRPGIIDNYSCGFECQDLSTRLHSKKETVGKPLRLDQHPSLYFKGSDFEDLGRSEVTLMASLVTVIHLLPRTVLLENVGGCAAHALLEYIRTHLPNYTWFGNQTDAADFGSDSSRFRLSIVGVHA